MTIRVHHSSINYKDALAATGAGKIIRRFPCVGGIDPCGEVVDSADARFQAGRQVIATSFDIGVAHHGGYAECARAGGLGRARCRRGSIRSRRWRWAPPVSPPRSASCAWRTTASPGQRSMVVTGATGGVGASHRHAGAARLPRGRAHRQGRRGRLPEDARRGGDPARSSIDFDKVRPLEAARWAGAVDNVGGQIPALGAGDHEQAGTVASIGNAASFNRRYPRCSCSSCAG